jgi:NADH-quinone oxidoreductase subunit L
VWIILSLSSLLTAFYMFRLVYLTFFNSYRGSEETHHHIHESPWTMAVPLIILCVLSVFGGVLGLPEVISANHWLGHYLSAVTGPSASLLAEGEALSHTTEILLMSIAGAGAIAAILVARYIYVTKKTLPEEDAALQGLPKLVSNKFYVDELYEKAITRPAFKLSDWWGHFVDKSIIDRAVNGLAKSLEVSGKTLRLFQNGHTGFYVFAMVIGMVVFFIIRLLI